MCGVTARRGGGARRSGRNFQPSLKGRSALQTASKRVQELSIRYMRPLGTSLGHIHSYCTCVSMSILNQPIGRCEQIMRCSGWPRSTPSRSHHEHSIDSCRGRRVANGNSLQHADSLCVARMRSAASWAAHRHEQPYTGASEDRASDAQEHDLLTLATAASSPAMTCIVSKRYPRGLRPPSSCSTDLAEQTIILWRSASEWMSASAAVTRWVRDQRYAYQRCSQGAWRPAEIVRVASGRACRLGAPNVEDLLGALHACTCWARTAHAFLTGLGRAHGDGGRPCAHLVGTGVRCRRQLWRVHALRTSPAIARCRNKFL